MLAFLKVSALLIVSLLVYGVAVPFLISYPDTLLLFAGIGLLVGYTAVLIGLAGAFFRKLAKEAHERD